MQAEGVEETRFSKTNVTSSDWVSYPILRFKDAPKTSTIAVNSPGVLPRGGAEDVHVQTPAAIANAFFDATGVRIRQVPMNPGRVLATLKAAGVA
jgi:nicotinate dehydrogenase subunit B